MTNTGGYSTPALGVKHRKQSWLAALLRFVVVFWASVPQLLSLIHWAIKSVETGVGVSLMSLRMSWFCVTWPAANASFVFVTAIFQIIQSIRQGMWWPLTPKMLSLMHGGRGTSPSKHTHKHTHSLTHTCTCGVWTLPSLSAAHRLFVYSRLSRWSWSITYW